MMFIKCAAVQLQQLTLRKPVPELPQITQEKEKENEKEKVI